MTGSIQTPPPQIKAGPDTKRSTAEGTVSGQRKFQLFFFLLNTVVANVHLVPMVGHWNTNFENNNTQGSTQMAW